MAMADDPKLKVVHPDTEAGEHNPTSIFNDLASLRKASKLTVQRKTVLVNVGVGKPANNVYFRAHSEWFMDDTTVMEDKGGNAIYFIVPSMRTHPKLTPRLRYVTLAAVCLWPALTVLLWPVPVVSERTIRVWKSARAAYELSREHWVQIGYNDLTSDYTVDVAESIAVEPTWPDKTFNELLKIAFDGKIVDNEEHPYVRRLRGLDT
jgi:hypothetical protein